MAKDQSAPVIQLFELPDFDHAVALHGARLDASPVVGVHDDLWIIAVILVYEK